MKALKSKLLKKEVLSAIFFLVSFAVFLIYPTQDTGAITIVACGMAVWFNFFAKRGSEV